MFSQAGSASDGVAWISSLLTAFLRWCFLLLRRTDAFTKRDRRMHMQMARFVIVYYSPVWTDKEREISANLVLFAELAFATWIGSRTRR